MGSLIPLDSTEMPNLLVVPINVCPFCSTSLSNCVYHGQSQDGNLMQARIIRLYRCPFCAEDFGIVVGYRTYHTLFEN